jgi:peptidoglycan/LPS O-acetylase OafA/YrhL
VVVLTHLQPALAGHAAMKSEVILAGLKAPGAIAVQFFFVLSGFVMLTAHRRDFGKPWAVLHFWWRRACRIYPMYWIAMLVPLYYFYTALTPRLLVEQIVLQPVGITELVPPAWSLRYEVSFYLMFGLCLLPYIGRVLLAAWFLTLCYCWCPAGVILALHLPLPFLLDHYYMGHARDFISPVGFLSPCSFYFFDGLLAAWLFAWFPSGRIAGCLILAAGTIGLIKTLPLLDDGHNYGTLPAIISAGFSFAGMILGVSLLERAGWLRFGALSRRLGVLSYPLYILHSSLLLVFDKMFPGLKLGTIGLFGLGLLLLAGIYGICGGFAFYVDQPLQHWLRRRVSRSRQPIPT